MLFLRITLTIYFMLTLLASSLSKLASPDYSVLSAIKFNHLFMPVYKFLYQTMTWFELGLSVLLAAGVFKKTSAFFCIVLFLGFIIFQTIFLKNKKVNCGCYGKLYPQQSDSIHFLVNIVQVMIAFLLYYLSSSIDLSSSIIQNIMTGIIYLSICFWLLIKLFSKRKDSIEQNIYS